MQNLMKCNLVYVKKKTCFINLKYHIMVNYIIVKKLKN